MDPPPVQYVRTKDGCDIAYAVNGAGPPCVYAPGQFSHVQIFWGADAYVYHWWEGLASRFRLICFDGRGQGMSTRNLAEPQTLASLALDLEAVIERTVKEPFVLVAQWHFCHVAVHYAIAHPNDIRALVLLGCSVDSAAWSAGLYRLLPVENWDAFLISQLARNFNPEQAVASLHRLRQTITREDYVFRQQAFHSSTLADALRELTVPTLVIHPKDFVILPLAESSRVAAEIPNARLMVIEGGALPGDPATGLAAIEDFLAMPSGPAGPRVFHAGGLTAREIEVLHLIAAGKSNPQIAGELVISLNTVQRHVSNILAKTGAANRTEAAGYARDQGLA